MVKNKTELNEPESDTTSLEVVDFNKMVKHHFDYDKLMKDLETIKENGFIEGKAYKLKVSNYGLRSVHTLNQNLKGFRRILNKEEGTIIVYGYRKTTD